MAFFGVGPVFKQKMSSNASQYPKDAQSKQAMMGYNNPNPSGDRQAMMGGMNQLNQPKISNPQPNQPLLNPGIPTNPVGNKPIPDLPNLKTEKTSSGKKNTGPFTVENPLYQQANQANSLPNSNSGGGPGGNTYAGGTNMQSGGNVANTAVNQLQPTSIQKGKSSGNAAALLTSPAATTAQKGGATSGADSALNTSQSKAGVTGKPSEIPTQTLKIGNNKFPNCKISTKIHFGKKQFVWEIAEAASPSKPTDGDDNKGSKKKFEVKFSDIEKIDVNTETQTITIDTKEKPSEYKEINQQPKKTTQWIKDEKLLGDDNAKLIVAVFGKDVLTKTGAGKQSHLDKIKGCELPLTINNVKYISEVPKIQPTEVTTAPALPTLQSNNLTTQISIPNSNAYSQRDDHQSYSETMVDITSIARGASSRNNQPPTNNAIPADDIEEPGPGIEEMDEEEEFPLLTKEKKADIKKFEGILKNMKNEDKIDLVLDVIKPERHETEPVAGRKTFKCPVDKCGKASPNPNSLKKQFQQNHKKLLEMGLDIDSVGNFQWKPELLDFCIMIAKIYPKFVKNVVRQSRRNK